MFTLAISAGIGHINISELKSIFTLLTASHLPQCTFQIPPTGSLAVIPSLQDGWVWCSSWKCISFFGKIVVSLMFNPRASVVMVPANSILIIQSGYSFYNWTTKNIWQMWEGNLKARWHKEIKFIFCHNQIFKKDAKLVLTLQVKKDSTNYRKVVGVSWSLLNPSRSLAISLLLSLLISVALARCWFSRSTIPKGLQTTEHT